MEITLDDVETALKILKAFLDKHKKLVQLATAMGLARPSSAYTSYTFDQFISQLLRETLRVAKPEEESRTGLEPTEEDLKRMREIARRIEEEEKSKQAPRQAASKTTT